MHQFVWVLILCWHKVNALNFDSSSLIEVQLNSKDIAERSYFGYSILLQKGPNSKVIVGAPKQSSITGGAVFSCDIYYLDSHGCTRYNISANNRGSANGNFLGSVVVGGEDVGDPFIVSVPKKVSQRNIADGPYYWLKGLAFYEKNSSMLNSSSTSIQPLFKIREAFRNTFEFGFAQAGFDIYYSKDLPSIYLGAPGVLNSSGSIVEQTLSGLETKPFESHRIKKGQNQYGYLGYKVTYGKINKISYIIGGAPRGNELRGQVEVFDSTSFSKYCDINGEQEDFGSYFGAAILAVDVDNDGTDELFIGAPTAKGKTFEEGCVYYYKKVCKPTRIKLVGGKKIGARFGTDIVSLGDIDLDSFNDIAISAPFEDDGVGAVYIYRGPINSNNPTYSQRLTPSKNSGNIRGFGLGLSKGVDVDSNGFNDLAIGAYKSGRVFVTTTKPIIDLQVTLKSNVSSITNNTGFIISYCVNFTTRAEKAKLKIDKVTFQMNLTLDARVLGNRFPKDNVEGILKQNTCKNLTVTVKHSNVTIPFKYFLATRPLEDWIYVQGGNTVEKSIPFAHGCGEDNICQTNILLNVKLTNSDTFVLGQNKSVKVNASAENVGEPGYECKIHIIVPEGVEMNLNSIFDKERKCSLENSTTHVCLFATKLENSSSLIVPFDVNSNNITLQHIRIHFKLLCLGENSNEAEESVNFNVEIQNSMYIDGNSDPQNFEVFDEDSSNETALEFVHTFIVGNSGPSPGNSDVHLLIPVVKVGNEDLFQLVDIRNNEGIKLECSSVTENISNLNPNKYDLMVPLNRTTIVDCFHEFDCNKIFCEGDILSTSSEISKYRLKFQSKRDLLVRFLHKQPDDKNILAFFSSAVVSGTMVYTQIPSLILSSHSKNIPLWVYVVGAIVGASLLVLLILLLFKCKFFEREYRDKLHTERQQTENLIEENDDSITSCQGPTENIVDDDEEGTKFAIEIS